MRTKPDLDAAFAQLVRDADLHFPTTREPTLLGHRHPPTRRWLPIAAAAAAVVAVVIALSATVWTSSSGTNSSPGGGITVLDPRSIAFRVDASSDLHVREFSGSTFVSAGHSNQEIWLADASGRFRVDVLNPGASIGDWVGKLDGVTPGDPVPGMSLVDINGMPGYFGQFHDNLDPTLGPRDIPSPGLVWEYAPGDWASIDSHRSDSIEADLIAVAQALDFGHAGVVRVPMRLSAPPLGQPVEYVDTDVRDGWDAMISYGPEQGTQVVIEVTNRAGAPARGEPTTVDGRPAVWNSDEGSLQIDAGDGVTIVISEADNGDAGPSLRRDQLVAIARTVSMSSDPNDQTTWFDAATAIP